MVHGWPQAAVLLKLLWYKPTLMLQGFEVTLHRQLQSRKAIIDDVMIKFFLQFFL
jgi:hypothetical protein